jgi:hypothetical protein
MHLSLIPFSTSLAETQSRSSILRNTIIMPLTTLVQYALACQECGTSNDHKRQCNRSAHDQRCKRCVETNRPCTPSREEVVLTNFNTLHLSLVPGTIDVSAFTPALNQHLRTNNAIFCTVIHFSALNLGGDYLDLAIKYNNDRVYWYRYWTDLHESNRWDEDIKPYLLYLLLVGPTLVAACHNERTRFAPDPAAHMSMITKSLCLAWSRVNCYLDLLIGDLNYS